MGRSTNMYSTVCRKPDWRFIEKAQLKFRCMLGPVFYLPIIPQNTSSCGVYYQINIMISMRANDDNDGDGCDGGDGGDDGDGRNDCDCGDDCDGLDDGDGGGDDGDNSEADDGRYIELEA
jgi:hypothetical protein